MNVRLEFIIAMISLCVETLLEAFYANVSVASTRRNAPCEYFLIDN